MAPEDGDLFAEELRALAMDMEDYQRHCLEYPVLMFRLPGTRQLHVVGSSALAQRVRALLRSDAVPGWQLAPVFDGRTPIQVLLTQLKLSSGSNRLGHFLARLGFGTVEEVAAAPWEGLAEIRGIAATQLSALEAALLELRAPDRDRRDLLAAELRRKWQGRGSNPAQARPETVNVLALLLDELGAARPDEPLGHLAAIVAAGLREQ